MFTKHFSFLICLIALLFVLSSCAPTGFVETTANVIDEMTAFRMARKQNTREGWEYFIREYPDSSKARKARQWLAMMPEESRSSSRLQEQLRRAEEEQAEKLRLQEVQMRREEEQRRMLEEAQRIEEARRLEEARRQEDQKRLEGLQQTQQSQEAIILMARLQKMEEELKRREDELKRREMELAKGQSLPKVDLADDIDVVPKNRVTPNEENFAIVIGIDKYRDVAASANYAEKDARTVLLYLRDFLGFPEQNIKLLAGDRATKSDFSKELELWLPLVVTEESKVFVYYSGHGAPDAKSQQAYLLPYDGDPKALEITAYPLKRLYEKLNDLPAKEIVVALDSCFSGAGGRSVIAQGTRPLVTKLDTGKIHSAKNMTVFAASAGEEITGSYENQKHGLFTYFFLRGLRGDADTNGDGIVSIQEEYQYVKKNVAVAARRDLRDQTPQLLPDLSSMGERANFALSKTR